MTRTEFFNRMCLLAGSPEISEDQRGGYKRWKWFCAIGGKTHRVTLSRHVIFIAYEKVWMHKGQEQQQWVRIQRINLKNDASGWQHAWNILIDRMEKAST